MTRFARAKGSKSSNEKKPEEATSWSEMKNSILSKKRIERDKPEAVQVKVEAPRKTEWASLGDEGPCESMLKPKLKKIKNVDSEGGKIKKKKEKDLTREGIKEQNSVSEERNKNKVKKKGKKRKMADGVDEGGSKKKKKLTENEENSVLNGKEGYKKGKDSKNFQEMKKNMKSRYFKNGSERSFNPKMGKKQFDKLKGKNKGSDVEELVINGEKIQIVKFQGFYVTLDDAERLKTLRSEMLKQGIPKAKLEAAIKLERRRAEKALSRLKKSVCFHCRGHGHLLSNCPNLTEKENTGTGICYKCGSTEHSAGECKVVKGTNFKFAECFICKEQGHIARQCPDNPRGLYPQGGACRECGDVTHLRKDCPKVQAQKAEEVVTVGLRNDRNLECLDEEIESRQKQPPKVLKKNKTVKF